MFDKRISQFAREKFQRGNIDMKMNFKVVRVSDKAITMTNQDTGETSLNYGMAVWSAGIGTRPIIHEFMKEVGQTDADYQLLSDAGVSITDMWKTIPDVEWDTEPRLNAEDFLVSSPQTWTAPSGNIKALSTKSPLNKQNA